MKKPLEDYFIPNKRNNYAPHGLQKAAMIGMVALVLLSFTTANIQSLIWISSKWMVSTILPAVIVDLTNEQRQDQALGTLRRNATLDEAARLKAQHMANNQYFAHYSPDGVSPWYWFNEVSYNFVHAGENLAIHFTDSGDVVEAWMESPTHRANIMNGNYSEIGVGTAEGTYDGYATVYVVQLFGTPAAPIAQQQTLPEVAGETSAAADTQEEEEVLSESVSLTEDVVIYEAEPEPVLVEEEVTVREESPAPAEEPSPSSGRKEQVFITDMESTPYGVALYSDFISTSTGGVPASIAPVSPQEADHAPFYMELATQPHVVLEILYVIIGLFVLISLMASILIEVHHQQPVQIAYGAGLLAIMGLLYYMHMVISNGALIV
jgi:hypothetical protein